MTTRKLLVLVAAATLIGSALFPTLPVGASHSRAPDPNQLALPTSALPPGAQVVHSGVSDNADADGAPSPDGYNDDIRQLHQKTYADLGRITGYRERFTYRVQGADATTQYLASVFAAADQAKAALNDASSSGSVIGLIGTPVSPTCSVGDACAAYFGQYGADMVIYTAFTRGPVLIELASAVNANQWPQVQAAVVTALYAVLAGADAQVQQALGSSGGPTATPAPTATPTSTPATIPAPPRKLGDFYLALGDSFAAGYLTEDRPIDTACKASDAPGFVCVFWRYLKEIDPKLQLDNLGEPGADSCELAGAGHRCYSKSSIANPVDTAVRFLTAHPGRVSPITVTIGGNDLLALLPQAAKDPGSVAPLLPSIFSRYRTNLDTILSRLRTAAPDAEIIVTTQPNSFGGLGSPPLPVGLPALGQAAVNRLNQTMKEEVPKYGALVADSAAAFDAAPGGANTLTWVPVYLPQGRIEIHPTPKGYKVYAETLIKASGYALPVKARLAAKRVKRGRSERVSGTTTAGLSVRITVWFPHRQSRQLAVVPATRGSFAKSFKVGKLRGKGAVQVCVSDADQHSACTPRMTFTVS